MVLLSGMIIVYGMMYSKHLSPSFPSPLSLSSSLSSSLSFPSPLSLPSSSSLSSPFPLPYLPLIYFSLINGCSLSYLNTPSSLKDKLLSFDKSASNPYVFFPININEVFTFSEGKFDSIYSFDSGAK